MQPVAKAALLPNLVEGTFRGSRVQSRVVVHVSIAQGTASDRIAAHADGGHRANLQVVAGNAEQLDVICSWTGIPEGD